MTPRTLLLAAIGLSAAIGCRRDPYMNKYVESLHGEIRVLEDYTYQLEHENRVLVDELAANRPDTPQTPARSPRTLDPPSRSTAPARIVPEVRPDLPDIPDLSPPVIEPGTPEPPSVDIPTRQEDQADAGPPPSSSPQAELAVAKPANAPVRDFRVARLVINPYLTGGRDEDQQPGDDGLMLVVEPRNAADQYLAEGGQVSVVLLDTELEGEASRVARWDFTPSEIRDAMGGADRGIRLWLPWSDDPPSHERLQLYVRYIAADGRKLQTNQEIFVTLPGRFSQRWTPRASTR